MITCKFCGNENADGLSMCYICGKSLTSGRITSIAGIGDGDQPAQQNYHAVNDNLPYGANAQTAARFQSDTGGGVRSGPTQETFGAQMMSGKTNEKKSSAGAVIAVVLVLAAAVLAWYCFFSANAPLGHLFG